MLDSETKNSLLAYAGGDGSLSAQEQLKLKNYVFPSALELRTGNGTIRLHLRARAILAS
ncbi:Hypothetical protein APO_2439 [Acetobacter pomorum DM001]|uniref:Uncharacterized protein n=1 Tax=Acetobacter pomorum DM001 TaxID=945681 RepID=F1YW31_9PROT|nr:Hypothetical protein APO_2439 [Acetobacter pomorum DM001]KGB26764.1 hypothetical protein ApDm4_0282 [Acetobacter pomorum]